MSSFVISVFLFLFSLPILTDTKRKPPGLSEESRRKNQWVIKDYNFEISSVVSPVYLAIASIGKPSAFILRAVSKIPSARPFSRPFSSLSEKLRISEHNTEFFPKIFPFVSVSQRARIQLTPSSLDQTDSRKRYPKPVGVPAPAALHQRCLLSVAAAMSLSAA